MHEIVDTLEIKKVYASADFLVNVGNSVLEFKPSKTFEYISTGKPIIHFYQNGIVDETLMRYPLSLQINIQDEHVINKKKICEFIYSHKGKTIDKSKIDEIFYDFSLEKIKSILYKSIKN